MAEPLGAGLEETVDRNGAFPRLGDEQRARLRAVGEVRKVQSGEVLFREGEAGFDFFVIESGVVMIVQGYGHENRIVAVQGPHRFLGEINLLTGSPPYLSAVVRDAGEVIQVSAERLRALVAENEELSNIILRAYLARREILIDVGAGVKLVGSRYSRCTHRLREFLARNRMPFQWMDLEDDEEADALLQALGIDAAETPVVISGEGVLRNPSNAEVAKLLGFGSRGAPPPLCDLVIVGAGPAGLAAAVYGASEGLDTQVIDTIAFGGQASTSARIENYLGFPTGISGSELAERATLQARRFGARMVVPAQAVGLAQDDGHYSVELADGSAVHGRTVIVATGAQYRKLDLPELERYEAVGIYYAATQAEAQLCAGDPVVIVGGGNSAGQAAMFLSRHAASCRLMIRGGDLGKSMSRYLIDELDQRPQVELMTYTEIVALKGEPVARGGRRRRQAHRRAPGAGGQGAVRVHRRGPPHRLAARRRRDGRALLPAHRARSARRRSRLARGPPSAVPRDEPARHLRGRRRSLGLDQARRLGGRGGLDGGPARAPAPREP